MFVLLLTEFFVDTSIGTDNDYLPTERTVQEPARKAIVSLLYKKALDMQNQYRKIIEREQAKTETEFRGFAF